MPNHKQNNAQIRSNYWRAYLLHVQGEDEKALDLLDSLINTVDSVADPYTANRIRDERCFISDWHSQTAFRYMLGQQNYYRSVGDKIQEANLALMISNSLAYNEAGAYPLKYLRAADSLYQMVGREDLRKGVRFNMVIQLCKLGYKEAGEELFHSFFNDTAILNNEPELEMLYRNHFYFFNDSASLFNGYDIVRRQAHPDSIAEGLASLRALYEALICEFYLNKSIGDSVRHYAELSMRHYPEIEYSLHILNAVQKIYIQFYEYIGNDNAALEQNRKYTQTLHILDSIENPVNKFYLENVETVRQYEAQNEKERQQHRLRLYSIIGLLLIIVLLSVIVAQRIIRRHKMKEMKLMLEAERNERQILSLALEKEETHKVLASVKEEASRISRTGNVSPGDIKSIEKNVRMHLAAEPELDAFARTFAEINPNFAQRLRNLAPDISDYNIRLCSYLLMGMSNNEIANIMHIKPGSMRQARLRLRQKFGLSKDESLVEFLRTLAE